MQISMPRRCPECNDGKKGDKFCIVCRGSGWVHLVPADRPALSGTSSLTEQLGKLRDEDVFA